MKRLWLSIGKIFIFLLLLEFPNTVSAWYDETHLAIARAAGYEKWYNAAGADIARIKAGRIEDGNHFVNNPPDAAVSPRMVLDQVKRYDQTDESGHLYGAVVASMRNYVAEKKTGRYTQYHLAYCAHYAGDLSMPLHNIAYDSFNQTHHGAIDGTVNDEVLGNFEKIMIYPIQIKSEEDLVREIARIANLTLKLGYQLESEGRLLTREEAYVQLGHSASLLKAILDYTKAAT